ncbi:hypothetical protein HKK52_04065 [Pseudomonas sp. ADAK2]|uniref:hypothetical protein n=1 Tax=unclassified Pseudomonas TaxID=196821 RepID=UPI001462E033|nr:MULTISPECIES: hypothetical protein [unclassified Pseudomonas]QJI40126.1 hypothetical protein HKK53_04060 [Pseudomonas sp. ADAK7]QJI46431.1 hypothetical protein HKK52_04065 [Pseudomonas sp. ADAK2]
MSSSLISNLTDKSDQRPQSGIYALVNTSAQHRVAIRSLAAEVSEERKRFSQQREIFNNRILELKEMLEAIDIQERLLPKTLPGWPHSDLEA